MRPYILSIVFAVLFILAIIGMAKSNSLKKKALESERDKIDTVYNSLTGIMVIAGSGLLIMGQSIFASHGGKLHSLGDLFD